MPEVLEELLVRRCPHRVVIEFCPSPRKIAIVVIAGRLLIWCWATMRVDQDWDLKTALVAA